MDKEEAALVRALKFVKVGIDYRAEVVSGFLTDTSIAMLLTEMRRRGIKVSLTNGESQPDELPGYTQYTGFRP